MSLVLCDKCPILHIEPVYEGYDPVCGLGYSLEQRYFKKHTKDDEGWVSNDCKLESIRFGNGEEYRPSTLILD